MPNRGIIRPELDTYFHDAAKEEAEVERLQDQLFDEFLETGEVSAGLDWLHISELLARDDLSADLLKLARSVGQGEDVSDLSQRIGQGIRDHAEAWIKART